MLHVIRKTKNNPLLTHSAVAGYKHGINDFDNSVVSFIREYLDNVIYGYIKQMKKICANKRINKHISLIGIETNSITCKQRRKRTWP